MVDYDCFSVKLDMADRRKKSPNKNGCKPTEDVCVEHDQELICRHGCEDVKPHKCATYIEAIEKIKSMDFVPGPHLAAPLNYR